MRKTLIKILSSNYQLNNICCTFTISTICQNLEMTVSFEYDISWLAAIHPHIQPNLYVPSGKCPVTYIIHSEFWTTLLRWPVPVKRQIGSRNCKFHIHFTVFLILKVQNGSLGPNYIYHFERTIIFLVKKIAWIWTLVRS